RRDDVPGIGHGHLELAHPPHGAAARRAVVRLHHDDPRLRAQPGGGDGRLNEETAASRAERIAWAISETPTSCVHWANTTGPSPRIRFASRAITDRSAPTCRSEERRVGEEAGVL